MAQTQNGNTITETSRKNLCRGSGIQTLDLPTQIMKTLLISLAVLPAIFWFDHVGLYMVATSLWGTKRSL